MRKFPTEAVLATPVQVEVRGPYKEDFDSALKAFKSMVNNEKILAQYKEHQSYEKPSEKKRRKRIEARKNASKSVDKRGSRGGRDDN